MSKTSTAICLLFISMFIFTFPLYAQQPQKKTVIKALVYSFEDDTRYDLDWKSAVEEFEKKNPSITIQYEIFAGEAYLEKVIQIIKEGGEAIPDIAYMGSDTRWGKPWKDAGQWFDHRPYIDDEYYDLDLIPAMGPHGEIWEIPLGTSNIATVLFMNEPLVKSLGFSTPETYEDLVAMVPKARQAGLSVMTIDGWDYWAWGTCLLSGIIARISGDPAWVSKAVQGQYHFTDQAFIDSLALIRKMSVDGIITQKFLETDYRTNLSNFSNNKALFMIQGQWASLAIEQPVQDNTVMLAWPLLPGEKPGMAGSVAAATQTGYGLTKKGGSNPAVRDGAIELFKIFNSEDRTINRLRQYAIVAPIIKTYQLPEDIPLIVRSRIALAKSAMSTNIVDAFLAGTPNDLLNEGLKKLITGKITPEALAAQVETAIKRE